MARVLAVDDEIVSQIVLVRMLEALGLEVVGAADVPEAAERIASMPFDLIVSDYLMPSGTGLDLAAQAEASGIPFILLTGFGQEGDLVDERAALVDLHLTKPVSSAQLAAAVSTFVPAPTDHAG